MNAIMKVQCSNKATENIKLDVHGNQLRQQFSILVLSTLLPRNIFNPQQYIPTSETPNSFYHLLHNKNFKVSHICHRDIPYLHYSNYDNRKKNRIASSWYHRILHKLWWVSQSTMVQRMYALHRTWLNLCDVFSWDVKNARQYIEVITTYIIGGKRPAKSSAERWLQVWMREVI
jgi:hypothetical protein